MGAVVKTIAGIGLIAASFFVPAAGLLGIHLISGTLIASLGASFALGGIAQALTKPKAGSLLNDPRGRLATIRQAAASRRVDYGQVRVGGILVFANSSGVRTAPTAQVQMVIALTGHAIDSLDSIKFDDAHPELDENLIGIGAYTGKAFVQFKYGYDGDTAFPSLISDAPGQWTSEHRMRGVAAAYVRLNFDEKLYPKGIPNITFSIHGKLVFDPRSDSPLDIEEITAASPADPIVIKITGHGFAGGEVIRIPSAPGYPSAEGTWGVDLVDVNHVSLQGTEGDSIGTYTGSAQAFRLRWSPLAALVIADYLMDPWVGMGVPWSRINEAVLIAAANVCEELVDDDSSPASTEYRYRIDGSFETSETPGDILAQMANAMAGHVVYIGGEWHIIPGAFRLAVTELLDSDIVAPMNVQSKRSRRDLFNGVKGTFPSSDQEGVETDFPAVTDQTYLDEDQGIRVWKDIFLPFTSTASAAQRLARIELNRNRRQIVAEIVCSMRAYELQPGDVVELTHERYGWEQKTFEVEQASLQIVPDENNQPALAVRLRLIETDVDVYGFAVDDYGNLIDRSLIDLLQRTLPFGWSPGMVARPDTTASQLRERTDYNFGIAQQYRLGGDGGIQARLRIAGMLPVNVLSQNVSRPRTRTLAATTSPSGGHIKDGERYYIAVCAVDGLDGSPPSGEIGGRLTALSDIAIIDVPSGGSDANTVTISDLRWHPDTAGWLLFFGTDPHRLSFQTGYLGALPSTVSTTGPFLDRPESITFNGFNAPAQLPNGYFEHLRGAPDQRFDQLRFKAFRAIHLGVWGGQVVSVDAVDSPPTQYKVTLNPATPFTVNALAGRFISLVGSRSSDLPLETNGGMPIADFLIESNDADSVTLSSGQLNPADWGFVPRAVVVVRTKATSVGVETDGRNYIADTGFGEGGQELGDSDPNVGGGVDSLTGAILRIVGGTGAGTRALISGNTSASSPAGPDRIYIEGEWEVTPDTTSIFIITDADPALAKDTDSLAAEKFDSFSAFRIDSSNLISEQYLIYAISVNEQGREAAEEDSPYREIYLFGAADGGSTIDADYSTTVLDRYLRVNTDGGPVAVTVLDPTEFPGLELLIENIGTSGNDITVAADGGALLGGQASITISDGETVLIRAYQD